MVITEEQIRNLLNDLESDNVERTIFNNQY